MQNKNEMCKLVQNYLDNQHNSTAKYRLKVVPEETEFVSNCWNVVVKPFPQVDLDEYYNTLLLVEEEIRNDTNINFLLLPVLTENEVIYDG